MKKFLFPIFSLLTISAFSQVKLRQLPNNSGGVTNYFQVGYEVYTPFTLGYSGSTTGTGATWAFEHWDGGLNFWKPFPSVNYGNYFLFIGDNGNVGVGKKPGSFKLDIDGSLNSSTIQTGILNTNLIQANVGIISGLLSVAGMLVTSDERLKTNIEPLSKSLEKNLTT